MSTLNTDQNNLSELINRLQGKDKQYAQLSKRFQYVYFAFIPIYLTLIIIDLIEGESLAQTLSGVCFLFGMVSFALIFRNYYKEYNTINYAEPTLTMLKKAARRYKPFQKATLLVLIPLIFIDFGLSLSSAGHLLVINSHLLFFGTILVSIGIGLIWWRYRYKSLRDDMLKMIRELES